MNKLNIETVSNKDALNEVLSSTTVNVPSRAGGRETEHTEIWSICHLLSTLSDFDALEFPLSLEHSDKPDFILECNKKQIGIEVTESIPADYAKCCAMAERENSEAAIDMSLFRWGSSKKSTDELRAIINTSTDSGRPWAGNRPEIEWAHHMNDAISGKLGKLNKTGYRTLPEYWLSIYDNLPLPNVHASIASDFLLSEFSRNWYGTKIFSRVFIERGPIIIEIHGDTATNHTIVDLWS